MSSPMERVSLHLLAVIALGVMALLAASCTERPAPAPPTPTPVIDPTPIPVTSTLMPDGDADDTVDSSGPGPMPEPTRPVPADMNKVMAPIESVEIHIAESYPPQYFVEVVSGLPNACAEFHSYEESRSGNDILVAIYNLEPKPSQQIACAEIYQTHRVNIPLGTDFQSGETYTVKVNETTETFVAQ